MTEGKRGVATALPNLEGPAPGQIVTGTLHAFIGFDWGEEIDLEVAGRSIPAEPEELVRRRRTPSSFGYRPSPLRIPLPPQSEQLPSLGQCDISAEATLFDFGGVSVALKLPFALSAPALTHLAGWLAQPEPLIQKARTLLVPLFEKLQSAIHKPMWKETFSEEFFVFQFPAEEVLAANGSLKVDRHWLAALLRLDEGPLSDAEVEESLGRSLSYSPSDLLIPDWASAVLVDQDCEETLQVIEFANLQLLEYRFIDSRLDDDMRTAYRSIGRLTRGWLPFWRSHGRRLRIVGELKVEAEQWFERTGNALKLVGDQYLARAYHRLAERFHLKEWEESIVRKLGAIEGIYRVLADQAATYRAEFLEIIVILLIILEIATSLFFH
jgi:hypothetical protein